MKKIFALASAVMLAFCLAVPVYADTAESTVTSETTSEDTSEDDYGIDGDALADDAGDSIDTIHNEITNQKDTLGGVFEGFSQVSQFMGYPREMFAGRSSNDLLREELANLQLENPARVFKFFNIIQTA